MKPSLFSVAWLIARDANLTFGGGSATAEVLRRSLGKRGWLSDDDHRRLYAISRLTPGTNLLAYCTGVGWRVRKSEGALVTWLASSIPASLIAVMATVFYERASSSPVLASIVVIGTGAALVLLLASAWHLAKPQFARSSLMRTLSIIAFTVMLVALGTSPIWILVSSAVLGALWGARNP